MSRHILYAYVDGNDLHDVASVLIAQFSSFTESRLWVCSDVKVVNSPGDPNDPSLGPEDLPDWDLGINFTLPDPGNESAGWQTDVEDTAIFLAELHAATGRDFVIGIANTVTGVSEDLQFIQSPTADLSRLRQMIGAGDIS